MKVARWTVVASLACALAATGVACGSSSGSPAAPVDNDAGGDDATFDSSPDAVGTGAGDTGTDGTIGQADAGEDGPVAPGLDAGSDATPGSTDAASDAGFDASPTDASPADASAVDGSSGDASAVDASLDGGTDGSSDAGASDASSADAADAAPPVCTGDLSNLGTGDFHVNFTITTAQGNGEVAVISQRDVCSNGMFWDVRMGNGQLGVETDDGQGDYTAISGTTVVNDGQPHQVKIARVSGTISFTIDGAAAGSTTSPASFSALPALVSGTDICVGQDSTVVFVGTLANVCVGSP